MRQVRPDEMRSLQGGSSVEFHLCRHYISLSPEYMRSLIGKRYIYYDSKTNQQLEEIITLEKILSSLMTKGSKFFNDVPRLDTPKTLIELIHETALKKAVARELEWRNAHYGKKTFFTFESTNNIGINALININDLPLELRNRIIQVNRGELEKDRNKINFVAGHPGKITNKISVIIGWPSEINYPFIITAHPGEYAPEFPNSRQDNKEFHESKAFWDQHVFTSSMRV